MKEQIFTEIDTLGKAKIESKVKFKVFVEDDERVLYRVDANYVEKCIKEGNKPISFEKAGPRKKIFFDPSKTRCAVVTCGGLSPGLNDVIRAIVLELYYIYNVKNIVGIKFGLQGFIPEYGHDVLYLEPSNVRDIHQKGGTILGTSRGKQSIEEIVDSLERMNINILFMIGGDGTLTAAYKIYEEISKRGLKISVIGIPKTIDNDIHMVDKTFGFDTAVDIAARVILGAHSEATGAYNGVGIVKVMGRVSGFIAAAATLSLKDVNFCLVPEIDFDLYGEHGLLAALKERLTQRRHAVIVVAEGAGQKFFNVKINPNSHENPKLGDIGKFLKEKIEEEFKKENFPVTIKYIDPSYYIRSIPANSSDHILCGYLAQMAVHAGMAGKTGMVVSYLNNQFLHVPIKEVIKKRKMLDSEGELWMAVLQSTGQPPLKNK